MVQAVVCSRQRPGAMESKMQDLQCASIAPRKLLTVECMVVELLWLEKLKTLMRHKRIGVFFGMC